MITIFEAESKKISGKTSLFIAFPFNKEIIACIKENSTAYFDKKTKLWEVPITSLAKLLDIFTYYDDITLRVLPDKPIKTPVLPTLKYRTLPFQYQLDGITYGLNHSRWLLLDAPGLGKTLQAIYLAEELSASRGLKKCLIVCGIAALRANWEKEIKKHSTKDCIIIGKKVNSKGNVIWDTISKRVEQLKNPIKEFFIIINIETLRNDDVIKALKTSKNEIGMIIFDEVHKCLVGDTLIDTNLGKLKIGDVVEKKIKCSVKSFNIKTGVIEYKLITDYHKIVEHTNTLIELEILDDSGSVHKLKCTPDHKIYTNNRGFIEARDLLETDDIKII